MESYGFPLVWFAMQICNCGGIGFLFSVSVAFFRIDGSSCLFEFCCSLATPILVQINKKEERM